MNLKDKRKLKGYSQTEISHLLEIPLRTYKRYEKSLESDTYKYKLIEDKINSLPSVTKIKKMKRRNIAIVGNSESSFIMGLLLSEKNKVVFINDSKDESVRKINEYKDKIIKIKKDFAPLKCSLNLNTYYEKRYLNNSDIIIFYLEDNNTEIIKEHIKHLNTYNPGSVAVISNEVPIGFSDEMNIAFGNVEIIYFPNLINIKSNISSYLKPLYLPFGVYRKTQKIRTTVSIFEALVLNNCKATFMKYKEAEAISYFNCIYQKNINEFNGLICDLSKEHNLDNKKIIDCFPLLSNK